MKSVGKKDHFAKVCRTKAKNEKANKDEEAAEVNTGFGLDQNVDRNWACGAIQNEEKFDSFLSYEDAHIGFYENNKHDESYNYHFGATGEIKNSDLAFIKRGIRFHERDKKVGSPALVKTLYSDKRGFKKIFLKSRVSHPCQL